MIVIMSIVRCFNPDMSITVRSAYGAEEGDSVSICYTDSLWATAARRENLVYSKDFLCNCDRCADETENETYMSALRCIKCPGYFLPSNPLGNQKYQLQLTVAPSLIRLREQVAL